MKKLLLLVFLFGMMACSNLKTLKENPNAEELFQHAESLRKNNYYQEALGYFRQLKSQFLYSRFAKAADLAIADIYFAKEEWIKASRAYESFSARNPEHSENDRALFQLSLSYFHQLPKTEDRDLSLSKKTLFYINKHLKLFPKSPYREKVRKYQQKTLTLLAKKEWMIAQFHLKKNRLHSARPYMLKLIKNYRSLLPKQESLSKTLPSLKKLKALIQKSNLKSLKKTL